MMHSCGPDVPPPENPGVALGIALGAAAARGRDKVTISTSPALKSFGAWAEQLFAESTGKHGKGLIPIDGEPLARPEIYGDDRFFIDLALQGESDAGHDAKLGALEKAGHPVVRIVQNTIENIGQEFFRFEIATAIAGAVLEINPFDQPDVEASKVKTRELTAAYEKTGTLPGETPVCTEKTISLYTDEKNAAALRKAGADGSIESWLRAHLGRIGNGDYAASWPISIATPTIPRICKSCGSSCATAAMSRPASNSARAFCIRPGKPTKAAPTAACFFRSRPTIAKTCRSPATAPALAL